MAFHSAVKLGAYFIALLMGVACVATSVSLLLVARTNQHRQNQLQQRQQALSNSVLGQQGQQISGSVLQDMANAALSNPDMQKLLLKHGYRVEAPQTPAAAALEDSESSTNSP